MTGKVLLVACTLIWAMHVGAQEPPLEELKAAYELVVRAPRQSDISEKALSAAAAAADALLTASPPTHLAGPEWNRVQANSHKTLGWVLMQRRLFSEAAREFNASLKKLSDDAEVSYWLGSVLLSAKQHEHAFFHFARAAAYEGPGTLAPAVRKAVGSYLRKAYLRYCGGDEGLASLLQLAAKRTLPPPDFALSPGCLRK